MYINLYPLKENTNYISLNVSHTNNSMSLFIYTTCKVMGQKRVLLKCGTENGIEQKNENSYVMKFIYMYVLIMLQKTDFM